MKQNRNVRKTMRNVLLGVVLSSVSTASAFVSPTSRSLPRMNLMATSADASAKALSDYMAKSHEEKLKAVREVEARKNAEIQVSLPTTPKQLP